MPDLRAKEARRVLEALDMWRLPVDPFSIAREEGIELAPGQYGSKFDGRIEYIPSVKTFILYYREPGPGRPEGRVRFSIGHELGHYYLHKEFLIAGQAHNSMADFRSRDVREQEADEFSASLLMPRELFVAEVKKYRQTVCVLSELCHLAEHVFKTSITSTVRRYCQCDVEPSSAIVSEDRTVKWAVHSEEMRRLGMGYVPFGSAVPSASRTAKLWDRMATGDSLERVEGATAAHTWFERPYRNRLWEEAMPLGYTGMVLTYLTLEDADPT